MNTRKRPDKFSREAIDIPAKIKKGKSRWNQCVEALQRINPQLLHGSMLDFGCGVGYFLLEGLRRDMDIWGIDQYTGKIKRYHKLLKYTKSREEWGERCLVGDGVRLPFLSGKFSLVTSWWVFEHIEKPGEALREMVRVTQPGGAIVIRAQDAHTSWEGHLNIPWVPYLPEGLQYAWIDEFGKSAERRRGVFDITQAQVISILEALGCRVIIKAEAPASLVTDPCRLCTEEEVRRTARRIKAEIDCGAFQPVQEGLYVFAQKMV